MSDLATELAKLGLTADLEAIAAFEEDLYAQNAVMNLTRVPREEAWLRHILDSLLIAEFIPKGAAVLDIGTGPGFPAWPLALARPDVQVTALDSSGKMLGFLRRHPLTNLTALQQRAEELLLADVFDVVTGRALAPLAIQLELSTRPCRKGGIVLPMRTPNDLPEIERLASVLGLELEVVHRRTLPVIDAERVFPVYRKKKNTPSGYPRPWAKMRERTF
ncbi:MAG: 16S rRNA (guanine(527)-N(7))-methyltransferase RsmG [Methanoregulaceae archaeon]|nr:16S rRNA (guanine(527)-N(7))-methyltransferase RsmG [Methanoregulaceae archaeon]